MHTEKFNRLILAASLVAPAMMFVPMGAQAGTTANISVANMYLWRGLDISNSTAQVSGTLQYNADMGLYAGGWASSLGGGTGPNYELDLYGGYSGAAGDFKYDASYWWYIYPESGAVDASLGDTDYADVVLSASYKMFSAAAYMSVNNPNDDSNDIYYTLGVTLDKFGLIYGFWTLGDESKDAGGDEYSHITLSYNPVDTLTFKVSMASSDTGATEEDPLVQVAYTWNFDLK